MEGPRGAVSHFEKSWHPEDQWLTAMSHAALMMIHQHIGNTDEQEYHQIELEKLGGLDSVDHAWIEAIDSELRGLNASMSGEEE